MQPGLAEAKPAFFGIVSVTVTPVAAFGPLFVTVIVYVRFWPTCAGSGESAFWIARSAAWQPTVYCVPPRLRSRFALAFDVNVCPRRPTRVDPGRTAGPCETKESSLSSESATVIVLCCWSNDPESAEPLLV